jgi:hypothetical protein
MNTETTRDLTRDQKLHKQQNENAELREQQKRIANGEEDEDLVEANINKEYKIKRLELNYVHVLIATRTLNDREKRFDEVKRVDVYHERMFDQMVNQGAFGLYDEVEVIHHPKRKEYTLTQLKPNQLDVNKQTVDMAASTPLKEKQLAKKQAEIDRKAETLEAETKRRNEAWDAAQKSMEEKQKQLDDLIAQAKNQVETGKKNKAKDGETPAGTTTGTGDPGATQQP